MNYAKRLSTFLTISLILAGCTSADLQTITENPTLQESPADIPGEALLLLTEAAADDFASAPEPPSLASLGIRSIERVFPDAGPFEERHRAAGLHRWYRVSYDPTVPRTKAAGDLGALPGVVSVQAPYKTTPRGRFNDPRLPDQWNYINSGQRSNFVAGADINVAPVWERYTAGSRDVVVAVIDGGVDDGHEDLAGVVLSTREGSRSFVYNEPADKIVPDEHGTHIAGTIAAINDNGIGVCGVAGGRNGQGGVRIMSCQTSIEKLGGSEEEALVWAADHGAVIASNSWGADFDTEKETEIQARLFRENDSALKSAIDYFIRYAGTDADGNQTGPMKGGAVIFACGNMGFAHDCISEYEPIIAVGAFGPNGKMPSYSNYGDWVDLIAPGGTSGTNLRADVLSTTPQHSYTYLAGTSMAAPHVAGVAALLVSYFGGPGFTNEDLRNALTGGAVQGVIDLRGRASGGKLDALGAFNYLLGDGSLSISPEPGANWTVKSHGQAAFPIRITGNREDLPVSVESDCPGIQAQCSAFGATVTLDALQAEPGAYSFTVRVGNALEKTFPFTILPNHAPAPTGQLSDLVVNANSAASFSIAPDQYFEDPDGETLSYEVRVSGDPILTADYSSENKLLTILPEGYGLATVEITARDARKAESSVTFRVLGRDGYRTLDVYPNPVTDWLHVRPATEQQLRVRLYNRLGACVYEHEEVQAGPFQPLDIDMQQLAGGVYTLSVNNERLTVTKL